MSLRDTIESKDLQNLTQVSYLVIWSITTGPIGTTPVHPDAGDPRRLRSCHIVSGIISNVDSLFWCRIAELHGSMENPGIRLPDVDLFRNEDKRKQWFNSEQIDLAALDVTRSVGNHPDIGLLCDLLNHIDRFWEKLQPPIPIRDVDIRRSLNQSVVSHSMRTQYIREMIRTEHRDVDRMLDNLVEMIRRVSIEGCGERGREPDPQRTIMITERVIKVEKDKSGFPVRGTTH